MDLRKLDTRGDIRLLEGDILNLEMKDGGRTITGVPVGLFNGHVVLQENLGEGEGAIENRYAYHVLPSTITAPSFKAAPEMRTEDAQPGDVIQNAIDLYVVLYREVSQGKERGRLFVRCQSETSTWEGYLKEPPLGWYSEYIVGLIHRPKRTALAEFPFKLKTCVQNKETGKIGLVRKIENQQFVVSYRGREHTPLSLDSHTKFREVSVTLLVQEAAADVPPGWKAGAWLAYLVNQAGEDKDWVDATRFQDRLPTFRETPPPIVKGWWNS